MERRVRIWAIAALAGIFSIASAILNIVIATNIGSPSALSALRALLYVTFVINLVDIAILCWFGTWFLKRLEQHALGSKANTWIMLGCGASGATVSTIVSGVALVWLEIRQHDLPMRIWHAAPTTLIAIWFAMWAITSVFQIFLYCLMYLWIKDVLTSQRASRLDMEFRTRAPSVSTVPRPTTRDTNRSYDSQQLTLNSPPRTPISRGASSTRRSSATRVGPGSSKTKLVRHSNRSSIEVVPFPTGDAMSVDSAFDNWDTSSVHQEMRAAIHSSPPVARVALETIPGSRPESAVLDAFLPQSPISSSPPHAATSDTAIWSSSPKQPKSSPPSSPINFSRPTSRPTSSYQNKPPPKFEAFDSSMQELIHPLFRPNSPHPPPIATMGTMVTASPMANTLITPKTLARLRSNSDLAPPHRAPVQNSDKSETKGTEYFVPDSPTLGSPSLGSPGPSIIDEADLPPILPSFVLSAGSRSSLVGYGKRKSLKKERPKSTGSMGSRLSQVMM
ncbi:hypothetical protein H2200_001798 [Cladophialophora chaetospira]|uniref:Uncharacterized protein n=1 Tax=Cladophialophora chaetospira TaxID=386627 RepID=A0AA38XLQ0_9EURO|nr:hypothetical protein H2200_001798 [Cladophialophora chaetospira]